MKKNTRLKVGVDKMDYKKVAEVRNKMKLIEDYEPFGLNPKQKAFADLYLYSADAKQSAADAGYAEGTHSSLLNNDKIRLYIQWQFANLQRDEVAGPEEVLEFLTRTMRGEVFEPTKVGLGKGAEHIQYLPPRVNDRLKAGELLGKRYDTFKNDLNINVNAPQIFGTDEIYD